MSGSQQAEQGGMARVAEFVAYEPLGARSGATAVAESEERWRIPPGPRPGPRPTAMPIRASSRCNGRADG